ncbi:hypothetical protein RCL1_002160 [Eukaryota sp. TZLM3-RCL]
MRSALSTVKGVRALQSLNPLACPKGLKHSCELCGKTARFFCSSCKVTHYCSEEHYSLDQDSIHNLICHLLHELRRPCTAATTALQRKEHDCKIKEIQVKLIEVCRNQATTFLNSRQFNKAIPPSLQVLNLSVSVFGNHSLQLVPAFMLLGEASLGLGNTGFAREYLSLASWILSQHVHGKTRSDLQKVVDNEEDSSTILTTVLPVNDLRARLSLLFGKLAISEENTSEAINHFAESVYFTSLHYGSVSSITAIPYFHLGSTYLKLKDYAKVDSFYLLVLNTWKVFLEDAQKSNQNDGSTGDAPLIVTIIGESQFAEIDSLLNSINNYYSNQDASQDKSNLARYVLGLLYS